MKTNPDLESILRAAPRPEPPEGLLETLEKQMKLPEAPPAERLAELWRRCRRFWLPLTGLAGAVAVVAVVLVIMSAGATRSFADTLRALTRVKSFHLVDRERTGPARATTDGGVTPNHPENPFVTSEYWFEQDPGNPGHARMRAASTQQDIWRENNRVLKVDHRTGARSVQLDNSRFALGGVGWWPFPVMEDAWRLHEVPAARMPGADAAQAAAFWFGECRVDAQRAIWRIWVTRTNDLPARIQMWSTAFPQVAPEVLMREWDFSDFNLEFPDKLAFEITDHDLASLGVTRAELDALGDQAMSFQLSGAVGAEVVGTLRDDAGVRQVKGRLPFSVVHVQHGKLNFDFRMADGVQREFELRLKNMEHPFSASTGRIIGWTSTNWAGRIEAAD